MGTGDGCVVGTGVVGLTVGGEDGAGIGAAVAYGEFERNARGVSPPPPPPPPLPPGHRSQRRSPPVPHHPYQPKGGSPGSSGAEASQRPTSTDEADAAVAAISAAVIDFVLLELITQVEVELEARQ